MAQSFIIVSLNNCNVINDMLCSTYYFVIFKISNTMVTSYHKRYVINDMLCSTYYFVIFKISNTMVTSYII